MTEKPVFILETLEQAGFEAYFVGGCVRDTLLGRPVHDWDITTSAFPEQTMQVFPKCVPTGLKHGTVTVVDGENHYEVTTFRCDGAYVDGRHPEQVKFVPCLQEDLARRDFTVNAMAMDRHGKITDLYGGREDLQKKQLRCVGNAEQRFREDALRMLRALRFSAQLGFSVHGDAVEAMSLCADLTEKLSVERVRDEMEKTLMSSAPNTVGRMARLGLLRTVGVEFVGDLERLAGLPEERAVRWAGFFHACSRTDWETFRLDRKTGEIAKKSAELCGLDRTEFAWKELISQQGETVARTVASLDGRLPLVEEILQSGHCLFLKDLAVSGRDFPHLPGQKVGEMLQTLLHHVLEHPEDNRKDILLHLSQKKTI